MICGFKGIEDSDTVYSGMLIPTFRHNVLPASSVYCRHFEIKSCRISEWFTRDFLFSKNGQAGPGAHPTSYSMSTGVLSWV
jgi:hypothetical protein